MEEANRRRLAPYLWLVGLPVLVGLLAAAPLWGPGMVNTRGGGDSPFLLWRTLEMAESFRHGIFPPRWMSHAAYDLGYPFFNHYAALPYYLSGALTALGVGPLTAIQATQTLGFVLAALTAALWARRLFGDRPAAVVLTSAAYTLAPFHMVNVYVRGDSLSEFYAFIWYPLILWALDRLTERWTARRLATATLSYSALILTHNVSALIFSPFALLYALLMVWKQAKTSRLRHPASSIALPFLLGILLTAWFWLPAIAETKYGQMGPGFTQDYFHYENHFRTWNLVQRTPTFDYSTVDSTSEAGPFAMGLVQAGLAVVGSGALIWRLIRLKVEGQRSKVKRQESRVKRESKIVNRKSNPPSRAVYLLTGLALATVMITPLSRPLWKYLPLLETTQFPWRFLSVQALFTAALTGVLAAHLGENNMSKALTLLCVIALSLSALLALQPDRLPITDADVTWDTLLLYESFTGNIGTTIRHEYLPAEVVPRLYISEAVVDGVGRAEPVAPSTADFTAELRKRSPVRQVWEVSLAVDAPVTFPLHWWPGWRARVDGQPADAYPMPGSGRLTAELPAGDHTVVLRLGDTRLRFAAESLSIATILSAVVGLVLLRRDRLRFTRRDAIVSGVLLLALALSLALPALAKIDATHKSPAAFFDFVQMPYPHSGPVDFGIARLEEAAAPKTAEGGETLTTSLRWTLPAPAPSLTGTLRLVSPAVPRHGVPYTLTATTFTVASTNRVALTLPDDLARGLYLLELRLHDADGERFARTAQGREMGALHVGAVRVAQGPTPDEIPTAIAQLGSGELYLLAVDEVPPQPEPTLLRPALTWWTPGTARNWRLSLRLTDAAGHQVAQRDLQPGHGYLPTTLWNNAGLVVDRPVLRLPEGLAPGDYTLKIVTYLQATMGSGGEAEVPVRLTNVTRREPPAVCEWCAKAHDCPCKAGGLWMTGVELPERTAEGDDLTFHARWSAVEAPDAALWARWEVVSANDKLVASTEGPPAPGAPTDQWPRLAWVRAPVDLALPPTLPDGPYRLRLIVGGTTATLARCTVVPELPVALRERTFEVPELPHPRQVTFADTLILHGYDYTVTEEALTLTLWWQAAEEMETPYKRFVHLYEAEAGALPVQDDAALPTDRWVAGEVVSETVSLDLGSLSPGTYHVGVGWYDAESGIRLPALNSDGSSIPEDRVPLEAIQIPR